jgi:predicted ABC-type ATPase
MKEIIIVAGPNGAGKTSFANQYLPAVQERLAYVNADEIARELVAAGAETGSVNIAAGRMMLERLDALINDGAEVMFETTLATRIYVRHIALWQRSGYTVSLIYLRLPNVDASLSRVARRVAAGGHDIPEATIRQRFSRSLLYLDTLYKPLVDDWYIWESLEGGFTLAETRDGQL